MMQSVVINEESRGFIPVLSEETFDLLEDDSAYAADNEHVSSSLPIPMLIPLSEADIILIGLQPLDEVIANLASMFSMLPKITSKADRARVIKALQPRIGRLEELYSRL